MSTEATHSHTTGTVPTSDSLPRFEPPAATHWPSSNFVLAAGTATYEPSTARVVIIEDTARRHSSKPGESGVWFLPRGRKDVGESLEECAVRETLEEAGYAATLLPTPFPTLQPRTKDRGAPHTEAFHTQLLPYLPRSRLPTKTSDMVMYLAFWYICVLPPNTAREADYGTHFVGAHERGYNSDLVDVAEAVELLSQGCFRYQYPQGEGENRVPGIVVDKETGRKVAWENVKAEFAGGVEALVVGEGWNYVNAVHEEKQWVEEGLGV